MRALDEGHGCFERLPRLRGIRKLTPTEIACTATLAADFVKYLLEECRHIFAGGRMLGKKDVAGFEASKQGDGFFRFCELGSEGPSEFGRNVIADA